jgi:hypothetical protein
MRSSLFRLSIATACLVALSPTASRTALAQQAAEQVSVADKAAARELFVQGVQLQQAGKYAEALDRFQRAQRVFNAPTHLLRIAECQAALGQLVEASETYRALARTELAPNAPQAFIAAKQQGQVELQQIEPRVPSLKVDVQPPNAPNLTVLIDEQPLNAALVGVARPINPGSHKVTVLATGYSRSDQQVTLKEREDKVLDIRLNAINGGAPVVVGDPNAPPPASPVPAPPPYGANAGAPSDPSKQPTPPAYPVPPKQAPRTSSGLLIGARLGYASMGGQLTEDLSAKEFGNTGGGVGLDAMFRFANKAYLGVVLETAGYSTEEVAFARRLRTTGEVSSSSSGAGLSIGYISNPNGFAFLGDIGVAYRWYSFTASDITGGTLDASLRGAELQLGAGLQFHVSNRFRLIPKASLGVGSFNKASGSCSSDAFCDNAFGIRSRNTELDVDVSQTGAHVTFFLGLGGYLNFDFK